MSLQAPSINLLDAKHKYYETVRHRRDITVANEGYIHSKIKDKSNMENACYSSLQYFLPSVSY
jgi:hypothetical protein